MPQEVPVIKIDPPNDVKKSPNVDGDLSNARVSFFLAGADDDSSLQATPKSSPELSTVGDEDYRELCLEGITRSTQIPPGRASIFESTDRLRKRASQVILELPAAHLKKIKDTEGIGSVEWESKHFCDTTTLHGPKRVFHGKRFSCVFWLTMVSVSFVLLLLQISSLVDMYVSHPIVSQVSFLIKEHGIDFPVVTLCNFNPVKKSYIKEINKTGDFSNDLLEYLMEYLQDANTLHGTSDRENLHVGQKALDAYQETHPDFNVRDFFMSAGFACEEQMMLCSFGGRQFNCCRYTSAILTNMGKCHRLDLQSSGKDWMMKQVEAGVTSGLQMILDAHLEEQFDESVGDPEPVFTDAFENGFRYYVHPPETLPYLTSEGISVSPTAHVYSAISTSSYILLPRELWGNCTSDWPRGFNTTLPYSAVNCDSKCKADYFNSKCGCSPFTYDIDNVYPMCSPFHTVRCIDEHIRKTVNGVDYYDIPKCKLCQIECQSIVYHAYNSYGLGFSNGALTWLNKKNKSWSKAHMKANFLAINVFFRDMSYTEYAQKQGTTLTETLSDIGGNMGMFLGMSVITLVEVFLYCSKVGWITFSKKRRGYMYRKKAQRKEHEKQLEETVSSFKMLRNRKTGIAQDNALAKLRAFTRGKITPACDGFPVTLGPKPGSASNRESEASERRSRFLDSDIGPFYSDDPRPRSVEINANYSKKHDGSYVNEGYLSRPRSTTAPPSQY